MLVADLFVRAALRNLKQRVSELKERAEGAKKLVECYRMALRLAGSGASI